MKEPWLEENLAKDPIIVKADALDSLGANWMHNVRMHPTKTVGKVTCPNENNNVIGMKGEQLYSELRHIYRRFVNVDADAMPRRN